MSDLRWHTASRHKGLPVSAQAHIGVADVKPRSGGRSQNRLAHEGKEGLMSNFRLHIASMHKGLPVSVKANACAAGVKPAFAGGRNQNRQLMRGKGAEAVR